RRFISFRSVVTSRFPDEPTGCPSATAPPLTLVLSQSISPIGPPVWYCACHAADGNTRAHARTCAAKASLISTRPTSFHATPAPGPLARGRHRHGGTEPHALGLGRADGVAAVLPERGVAARPRRRGAHQEHRGAAVRDLRGVARRHRPEALVEVGLQLRERLH